MPTVQLDGRIVTTAGVTRGTVVFDRVVRDVREGPGSDRWIVPGFVDLHLHGGGGGDAMAGADGLRRAARFHLTRGTTSMLPTTLTAPFDDLERALVGIREVIEKPGADEARVLGCHLEGPWINPSKRGAQPAHARPPEAWEVERLLEIAPVRVVTVAPEIEGVPELIAELAGRGIRVQVGHSLAGARETLSALAAGAAGFTHLFNAMSGMEHRSPGVVAAALAEAEWAEVIVDGMHVDAVALRAAQRAIPGLYAVSDAIAPTGLGDGEFDLGGQPIEVMDGVARMADGTLAGSVGTLDEALRRLVAAGDELPLAVRRVATLPADYLGRDELGRIEPGAVADLVVLDDGLRVCSVWLDGRELPITAPMEGRGCA
jgi:N-acetylglucosamine-6-phosphate deacetylase